MTAVAHHMRQIIVVKYALFLFGTRFHTAFHAFGVRRINVKHVEAVQHILSENWETDLFLLQAISVFV